MNRINRVTLRQILVTSALLTLSAATCIAGYKNDIGFEALKAAPGFEVPDGSTIPLVTQTEAATLVDHDDDGLTSKIKVWMPDPNHPEFSGKTIVNRSGSLPYYSGHATGVGLNFYGAKRSMTPGITVVESYLADHWLGPGFLISDSLIKPLYTPSRIANHSWVASMNGKNSDILRRIDWVVSTDETIQVVGPCRPGNPLLGSAFNTIAVSGGSGESGQGTVEVDAVYTGARTCPQLVAPLRTASSAAPVVASAAALLIALGHGDPGLSTDPVRRRTADRNGAAVYNAERSEVIKAALMAGADRATHNAAAGLAGAADITDYRAKPIHQAANGLDRRYGAGQVDIASSYRIIAAGEQNSIEDLPASAGAIGPYGFDYDPAFGGEGGSNPVASYYFKVIGDSSHLFATLAWNIVIAAGAGQNFPGTATLYDLDLFLLDVTGAGEPRQMAASTASADNTENLGVELQKGHRYMLQVKPGTGQAPFNWDYALAWQITKQT